MTLSQEDRAQQFELQRLKQLVGIARSLDEDLKTFDFKRSYIQCATDMPILSVGNLEIFESGNAFIDKTVTAFSVLAAEVENLVAEAQNKYYDSLLLYSEQPESDDEPDALTAMSRFLPFLQDLLLYVRRCQEVCKNLLSQLLGFYNLDERVLQKARDRRLSRVWNLIGNVLVILTTLDEIIISHEIIAEHYKYYHQTMLIALSSPGQFGISESDTRLKPLLSALSDISTSVISGRTLQNCCTQTFSSAQIPAQFMDQFRTTISEELNKWERLAQEDVPDMHRLMTACSLSVLYFYLNQSKSVDKKLLRALCATQKKLVTFHLVGDVMFTPTLFLLQQLPPNVSQHMDKKITTKKSLLDAFSLVLNQQAEQLHREVQSAVEMINEWKTEMKSMISYEKDESNATVNGSRANNLAVLRCYTVLKGVRKADQISRLVRCVLNGHLSEDRSLSKQNAQNIFRLIELIKSVSSTLDYYWPSILEWNMHALLFLSSAAARIFEGIRTELSAKAMTPYLVDVLSALKIATLCVAKSPTKFRLLACGFAMEIGHYQKNFRSAEINEIEELLRKLRAIITINLSIRRTTDCSFLYWHRSASSIYFKSLFEDVTTLNERFNLFAGALDDASRYLKKAKHSNVEELVNGFGIELFESFKDNVLDPLCANVENDLRLSIHEQQNVTSITMQELFQSARNAGSQVNRNSTNTSSSILRLIAFFALELNISDRQLRIKEHVEDRMQKTFYELTAVALHDSEIYKQMGVLAERRFGLKIIESNLPQMFINQGVNLLEIVTNFDSFVSSYNYDFNEQMFIEKDNKAKTLNVLRVPNIVGSIRTHGLGVLNTTVNFAYQSLAGKLRTFSRFLFNEQIRNQLVKDIRYYRDSMDELKQMYPVRRAERFNNAMAKLGIMNDGQTYLTRFCELLSQIGNVLGFVRMVRTAAKELNFDETDRVFNNLTAMIEEKDLAAKSETNSSDYLEMLVEVFVKELRNVEKFSHLRNFFMIIPPLCINFIERMVSCRQNFAKRHQMDESLTFTDDGFSMGIAYMLTLLNQSYFFDSLNWFTSVETSLNAALSTTADEHQAVQGKDESYAQTLKMRAKRLEYVRIEFQYLGRMVHSALMLLSKSDLHGEEEEMFLEDY
ncbi:hypothetical protein M3Y96_01119900 [Aphelenchoides besseyi]|nr:hypothetical protein M3Y96_01119900 [Aphelenchoides besseyi]